MTQEQIEELKRRWKKLCDSNYAKMGDVGSCVLGAGLMNGNTMIIKSWDVCNIQGCSVWESGLQELIKEFNLENNTKVWYEYGNMD
jgi:hypothetical protein